MIRTRQQVAKRMGDMGDAFVRRVREDYADGMLAPVAALVNAFEPSGNDEADLRRLHAELADAVPRMDDAPLAESLSEALLTAHGVGYAAALPAELVDE